MKRVLSVSILLLIFLGGCATTGPPIRVSYDVSEETRNERDPRLVQRPAPYAFIIQNDDAGIDIRVSIRYPDGQCKIIAELGPEEGSKKLFAKQAEFVLIFEVRESVNGRWKSWTAPVEKKMSMYASETGRIRTLYVDRWKLRSNVYGWQLGMPSYR